MPQLNGASELSSLVSLLKTIVGAGLMSIPLAFSTDGVVVGVLIVALAAITSGYGLFLQAYVARFVPKGHATFFNICSITYPALSVVFDTAIAVQCFGCAISYLVLIGDLMPTIVEIVPFVSSEHHRSFWILASGVLCVPLSFLKNLDSLKYTSILGLVAIGYLALLVVCEYFFGHVSHKLRGEIVLVPSSLQGLFSTFSIVVFAYTGHQNMFSIINEAANNSLPSMARLINFAVLCASVLFILVGLTGYLTFGDKVGGNVILLYPSSWYSTVGRVAIVFMVIFLFPLMLHPARISVNNIYFWIRTHIKTSQENAGSEEPASSETSALLEAVPSRASLRPSPVVPFPDTTFYTISTILLVVGYTAAVTIKSFALVLAIVGATGSTAISFILPGLFGYKLIGSDTDEPTKQEHTLKYMSLALVLWGFVVMVVCLYSSLAL